MGAQVSKTAGNGETAAEKPGEAAASPSKANGQVTVISQENWFNHVVFIIGVLLETRAQQPHELCHVYNPGALSILNIQYIRSSYVLNIYV